MRTKSLGVVVLLALTVGACSGDTTSMDVEPDEPVLQISSEGGFVPVDVALGAGPRFTLLGDGTLIFPGVTTLEFPGQLVPPYLTAKLNDNQMNAVMAMVEDIGLADIDDETDDRANQFVADATTEVIRYWDNNGEHRYAVYALGLAETSSERNDAFLELVETLDQFVAGTTGDLYEADRVRVLALPATTTGAGQSDSRPWPLDDSWDQWQSHVSGWQCRVFDADILEHFEGATQVTTWEIPEEAFGFSPASLLVRPLHPGESDCP